MSLIDDLRSHPFLSGLGDAHLDLMIPCAREAHFAANQYLLHLNQVIDAFHLVIRGRVSLETCDTRGACIPVLTLEAGAAVGWSWLVPPYQSYFDARAIEPTTTLAFDCSCLRAAMDASPEFGYAFLKRALRPLLNRLQACRMQMSDVYSPPGRVLP